MNIYEIIVIYVNAIGVSVLIFMLKQAKYEEAVRHEGTLRIVTPDWVVDSVRSRGRCEEGLYHPRLLILPKPHSPTPPPAPSHSILSRSFGSIGRFMLW
jgi:hypothetical protein